MPHPKRQSLTPRKRSTERQLALARRSRSIKSSWLHVLSLDLVALYQADRSQDAPNPSVRNRSQATPWNSNSDFSDRHPTTASHPDPTEIADSGQETRNLVAPKNISQSNATLTIAARCLAFVLGILIRYALILYFQRWAILLLGILVAISGISVLMVVVFVPRKKKLLWNLSCLFGGLLVAVLFL